MLHFLENGQKRVVNIKETLGNFCRRTGQVELLMQWDTGKNGSLTPDDISFGSKKTVWWSCDKGHLWQASITSRTSHHTGCPYCNGKYPMPGETDLGTLYPDLKSEWHPTKNAPLTPDQILPGSHKKIWWRCKNGHDWCASVKSRVSGYGCPICANRELKVGINDLASCFPELAKQWHPSKNGSLHPEQVLAGTSRKVWWKCEKGHEWKAQVSARVSGGSSCPVCSGKVIVPGENDLYTYYPLIAKEWAEIQNGALTPSQLSPYSNRRVWWRCEAGHIYKATVSSRTMRKTGCPYCAGKKVLRGFNDLETIEPELTAQWHPTLNGALMPYMVTAGSHQKVWWQCPEGHVWKAVIYSRTGSQRCGCPVCAGKVKYRNKQGQGSKEMP